MASNATAGPVELVNTYTTDIQSSPTTTALADGGWLVSWVSYGQDGDQYGIYQQRYDSVGVLVGGETQVNTYTTYEQLSPATAALSDGGWVVSWVTAGQDGDLYGIYQQRYDSAGVLVGGEALVNTYTTNDQFSPTTAALSDGGWVVSWTSLDQDGSGHGIYQQRYNNTGFVVGGETPVNTHTTGHQFESSISALSDGGWVVSWSSAGQDGNEYGIYQQRYNSAGVLVGGEALVNTYTTDNQFAPTTAALADGGWVVSWTSSGQDGSGHGIYQQRYDSAGVVVGGETQVNNFTTDTQTQSSATALADGGWVVSWTAYGQDGDQYGIYQQRYDSAGVVVGGETQVNNFTTDSQTESSVTALADGGWVVSWTSYGEDGESYGIYQRHFAPDRLGTGAADTLSGTEWGERLIGYGANDRLIGKAGDDTLEGGDGNDRLLGGDGNDTLRGGAGQDVLWTILGSDTFVFAVGDTARSKAHADTIKFFSGAKGDRIDLQEIDANTNTLGDEAFDFIGRANFSHHAGELRYEKMAGATYVLGDTDGNGKADFAIHIDDSVTMKAGYFIL